MGVVRKERLSILKKKIKLIEKEFIKFRHTWLKKGSKKFEIMNENLRSSCNKTINIEELLKRPEVTCEKLFQFGILSEKDNMEIYKILESQIKYRGYIKKQELEIQKKNFYENIKIPKDIKYQKICGLSKEVLSKLDYHKPNSIGQASRISGVTPSAISILLIWMKKRKVF